MAVTGPDVSHWQGSVDFTAVKAAGHPFAILKASYGVVGTDPMFAGDRVSAHKAGLAAVGMYHFAGTQGSDGLIRVGSAQLEAANYLKAIGSLQPGEFPVLDFEPTAPPANPVAWCADWLGWVFGQTGVMPTIYMNQSTRDRYDWAPVVALGAQLWLAKYDGSYTDNPGSSGRWPRVAMEQYTDVGTVPGVPGLCDVNVFYGSASDLAALGHNPTPGGSFMAGLTDAEQAEIRDTLRELRYVNKPFVGAPTHLADAVGDVFRNARTAAAQAAIAAKATDPDVIAAAVVAKLGAATGGLTADQLKAAVKDALTELVTGTPAP